MPRRQTYDERAEKANRRTIENAGLFGECLDEIGKKLITGDHLEQTERAYFDRLAESDRRSRAQGDNFRAQIAAAGYDVDSKDIRPNGGLPKTGHYWVDHWRTMAQRLGVELREVSL